MWNAILTSAGLRRIEQEVLRPQPARASQRCGAAEFVNRLWMVLVIKKRAGAITPLPPPNLRSWLGTSPRAITRARLWCAAGWNTRSNESRVPFRPTGA